MLMSSRRLRSGVVWEVFSMRASSWCFGLGLSVCLASVGCAQNSLGDPTGATCPESSTLTYESFGKAFFQANCLECHASKESPHFNTLEDIQAAKDEIDRAAASGPNATNTYMPDDGD